MKRSILVILFLFVIMPHSNAWCQNNNNGLVESFLRFQGFYATIMHTAISGFPLTYKADYQGFPSEKPIKSSSSGLAYAIGVSVVDRNKIYLGLKFEFLTIRFTDKRISNRKVFFYTGAIECGILIPSKLPSVVYLSLGLGGLHQSDYPDWLDEYSEFEYLEETDGYGVLGIGIKISPIKNLIVEGEIRYNLKDHTFIPSDDRDWYWSYEEKTTFESIGRRVSIGLTYIFGGKLNFFKILG